MQLYPALQNRDLPEPKHWSKAIGVGIVVMGLAMGTGELILWPHLVTKHGLGILWFALIGILSQYFINQEVARYTLATGESFFTASGRIFRWLVPFWFFSAILLYIWPGWASAIGTTLTELFGFGSHIMWSRAALVMVLVLTFSGRVAYRMLERSLKVTVPTFFMLLVFISFYNLNGEIILQALKGVVSFGYFPEGIDINLLLGAVVFSGAGGMLNLCVGLWYRDKQNGMGQYAGRITNPITGKSEAVPATGYIFSDTRESMRKWRGWMRYMFVDQGIVFLFVGFITLLLLSVNAYAVLVPRGIVPEGLQIAVVQAHIFGEHWGTFGYNIFLVMAFLMLFSVMWTVIDALTRMMSDMIYTNARVGPFAPKLSFLNRYSLGSLYYTIITGVVVLGMFILPWKQPLALLTISAVLGGLTMAIYVPLLIYVNNKHLPCHARPGITTNIAMTLAGLFYAGFSILILQEQLVVLFVKVLT